MHACAKCNKTFLQAGNLKKHLLIHSGEKPHKCNECNKLFTQAGDLRMHILTHSGEKPQKRTLYNYSTIRRRTLRDHIMTRTGERPHGILLVCGFALFFALLFISHVFCPCPCPGFQGKINSKGEAKGKGKI